MRRVVAFFVVALLAIGSAPARAENSRCFSYSGGVVTTLPTLGGLACHAYDINDAGQIVGWSSLAPGEGTHAFLANGGVLTDLGTLGGEASIGVAVNEAGMVAGDSLNAGGVLHAFRYSTGVMTDLGTLSGQESSRSTGINDAGQVIGESYTAGGPVRGFVYQSGVLTDLGTLGGDATLVADINDAGQIVGQSKHSSGYFHAFLYAAGAMTDLGTLGGNRSVARAINDAGQVVGWSDTSTGAQHAFLYEAGVMTDLGTLDPLRDYSFSIAVNEAGQITGRSDVGIAEHGFLYDSVSMTDLGLGIPVEINDSGVVLVSDFVHALVNDGGTVTTIPSIDGAVHAQPVGINSSGQVAGFFEGDFCPDEPLPTCLEAERSSLRVKKGNSDGMDSFQWKWSRGPEIGYGDLGGFADGLLCVYDTTADACSVATKLKADSTGGWDSHPPTGWFFEGSDGNANGIRKIRLKSGEAGKSSAQLTAKGAAIPMPAPANASEMFDQDPVVTVQFFHEFANVCWQSEFAGADVNETTLFKARTP